MSILEQVQAAPIGTVAVEIYEEPTRCDIAIKTTDGGWRYCDAGNGDLDTSDEQMAVVTIGWYRLYLIPPDALAQYEVTE